MFKGFAWQHTVYTAYKSVWLLFVGKTSFHTMDARPSIPLPHFSFSGYIYHLTSLLIDFNALRCLNTQELCKNIKKKFNFHNSHLSQSFFKIRIIFFLYKVRKPATLLLFFLFFFLVEKLTFQLGLIILLVPLLFQLYDFSISKKFCAYLLL